MSRVSLFFIVSFLKNILSTDVMAQCWRHNQNVFYHPNLLCVTKRNIKFEPTLIDVGVDIDEEVNDILKHLNFHHGASL